MPKGMFEKGLDAVKEKLKSPETKAREAVPWIDELNLRDDEIQFIAQVAEATDDWHEYLKKAPKESAKEKKERVLALDLVRAHLMLQRINKEQNVGVRARKAEDMLDDIILNIYDALKGKTDSFMFDDYSQLRFQDGIHVYKRAKTIKEKTHALAILLNVIHHGGTNIVLEHVFAGVPIKRGVEKYADSSRRFLTNLNNLGGGKNGTKMNLVQGSIDSQF